MAEAARKSLSCTNPWCGGGRLCSLCEPTSAKTEELIVEGARETVRRALAAADAGNHAGEQAVMAMAARTSGLDFGDVASAAFRRVTRGGVWEDQSWDVQQHYIDFAVDVAIAITKPAA